jgi:CBS-domain-containing membrane protein
MEQNYPTAMPDTTLADLIPFIATTHNPVPVVDEEQTLLGTVDQVSLMLALGGADVAANDSTVNPTGNGLINGATDRG